MARTTVADVLADGLARAGAGRVFAAPGADASLTAAAERHGLDVIATPDALAGGVLAAVTGEVGDGPGAVVAGLDDPPALVRGVAHAQRDRAPLIVITGTGADAGLLAPVVKGTVAVEASSAGHWIAHAAQLAMADPRGPAHLVVAAGVAHESALPVAAAARPAPLPPPEAASLEALAAALAGANRPLLVTGLECGPDDARWIRAFAETLPAPVLATVKGRGALAEPHPLALGALVADHPVLARPDLVVLLGVDAGELPPGLLPGHARVARIGRAPWPDGGFVADARGDLALVVEELAPTVRGRPAADWDVAELDRIKRAVRRPATPAARLVALAREATTAGTLATGDVSALTAWQAVGPRETLAPLGQPPPGYAVLAAVAAQLAHADRRVIAFTSPAGVGEDALRLTSARGLPLVVVVLGELPAETATRLDAGGVVVLSGRGERDFTRDLSRALLAARPAVVVASPEA
jgi:acetolactate synthase I/II/III large subunit